MAFLFDTNVFLEILLDQDKKEVCKKLLFDNPGNIYLSDFSLHSIGVILLKQKKLRTFDQFLKDVLPNATILSLPNGKYSEIIGIASKYKMDFDDSYQALIAIEFELVIKTMDKDFTQISKVIPVEIF
jgi:predicted nucleic acid-binding protein